MTSGEAAANYVQRDLTSLGFNTRAQR